MIGSDYNESFIQLDTETNEHISEKMNLSYDLLNQSEKHKQMHIKLKAEHELLMNDALSSVEARYPQLRGRAWKFDSVSGRIYVYGSRE